MTPYSTLIASGQHAAFPGYQAIAINPRVGFSWSPLGADSRTVVRGGFGMFTDVFPGTVADDLLNNAPTNVGFNALWALLRRQPDQREPGQPDQRRDDDRCSNAAFQAGFKNGASYYSLSNSVEWLPSRLRSLTTAVGKLHYPTYEEYSLQVEQAIDREAADGGLAGLRGQPWLP